MVVFPMAGPAVSVPVYMPVLWPVLCSPGVHISDLPIVAWLRQLGMKIVSYIDDFLLHRKKLKC